MGIPGKASELSAITEVDGKQRDSGIESVMDLDAIYDHVMKRFRAKTGELLTEDWDEESEESEEQDIEYIPEATDPNFRL